MRTRNSKIFIFLSLTAFIAAVFFSQCNQRNTGEPDIRGSAYADEHTCVRCHKDVYQSYHQTGHFHTSSPITGDRLPTGVKPDSNVFMYNDSLKVVMEKNAGRLFQTAYFKNKMKVRQEKFDIAFGSAERAQTYGYWKGNKLYELPLSYFRSIHNWAVSPGFSSSLVFYNRAIVTRCLECHASFVESHYVQGDNPLAVAEEFNKTSLVYGIDCQRCHGPAGDHVDFQSKHPEVKTAKFIQPYRALTRQRQVEMCAVCHSGNDLQVERSTFLYKPGDTLARFFEADFDKTNEPDVHGNQAKLLERSQCFIKSNTLTCTTCHSSHTKEISGDIAFSQKCLTCHKTETHNFCKMAPQLGNAINGKCIDCHMPNQVSKVISFTKNRANATSNYLLHTHRIAIYPENTKQVLSFINNTTSKH